MIVYAFLTVLSIAFTIDAMTKSTIETAFGVALMLYHGYGFAVLFSLRAVFKDELENPLLPQYKQVVYRSQVLSPTDLGCTKDIQQEFWNLEECNQQLIIQFSNLK